MAIEELKIKDPIKYDVVGIGLLGVPEGGAYAHLLKYVSRLIQPGNNYTAGLDWGFKKDPLTVILLQTNKNYEWVNALEELQIVNESRWSNLDLTYKDHLNLCLKLGPQYLLILQNVLLFFHLVLRGDFLKQYFQLKLFRYLR